ncbi:DUF7009 family protein [Hymenobacter latericus]|uniref:DUF7009 family protein n=1 Tax=Hymenobacter sp. YIM 151858-1 TaxID=2987688 RepID=UPI0022270BD7|nr:hypothetical protein [Hymenobacter sp. YIM 151858-1]UYZ59828.1 hypothetical protein OIS50_03300 [Hymenobacter sp. YIM 151858-1]
MKLRLEDSTLRLRLSDEEVQQFAQTGHLASVVPLAPGPDGRLTYALQLADDDSTAAEQTLRVAYTPGTLSVLVPASLAQRWLAPDQIGLSATLRLTDGNELRILVEKDLGCRH